MKYPVIIRFLIIALIAGSMTACKKNSSSFGPSLIMFVNYKATDGNAEHYRIVYDINDNVDSIVTTGGGTDTGTNGFLVFNYYNSSFSVTDNNNNTTNIDINTNLLIDTIFTAYPTYIYYNGSQIGALYQQVTSTVYPYYTTNAYQYTYTNGNITSINIAGTTTTYDYNTGKSGALGDPQRIVEFLQYGRPYTKSNNLPTDMIVNGVMLEQYSYAFDSHGRISTLTKVLNNTTGGTNDTLTYAYVYNY